VQTTVQAGTAATVVRVTAQVQGTNLVSQSDQLVVSTGIPDQDSFSIAVSQHNSESFQYDGVTTTVTVFAADRYNNPVPDGTAVFFTTERGQAVGFRCTTANGTCTVTARSQGQRPSPMSSDDPVARTSPGGRVFPGGGRATILATAIGEESFVDNNANGVFDAGDTFTDLPEAFVDWNENGRYDAGIDRFEDFNGNGVYDGRDGKFNGLLCQDPTRCGASATLHVRASNLLIMSTSEAYIELTPEGGAVNSEVNVSIKGIKSVTIAVWDANGNTMAPGTTVAASIGGDAASLVGPTSFTLPDSTGLGPTQYVVTVQGGDKTGSAELIVNVTSTKGLTTSTSVGITVH
jgi:hypothetical protein